MATPKPCMYCGAAPKQLPKRTCAECTLMKAPMDQQVTAAIARRQEAEQDGTAAERVPSEEWPTGRRWCAGCYSFRRIDLPNKRFDVAAGASRCRPCQVSDRRRTGFGLAIDHQSAIVAIQGDRCGACGRVSRDRSLAVDHLHGTTYVRGYLCARCNHGILGTAFESVNMLAATVAYLLSPPGYRAVDQPGAPKALSHADMVSWFSDFAAAWLDRKPPPKREDADEERKRQLWRSVTGRTWEQDHESV